MCDLGFGGVKAPDWTMSSRTAGWRGENVVSPPACGCGRRGVTQGLRSSSGASQVDDEDESRSRDAGRTHEASAAKDIEATPQGRGRGRRAEVQCRLRNGACTSYAPRGKGMW